MDIHRWLSETVLPQQPPSPPEQGQVYNAWTPKEPEQAPHEKPKQKRSTSDSSLLKSPPRRKKGLRPGRVPSVEQDADEMGNTDASHPTCRSERSISSAPYRRRPRRKTRPERYEPLSKDAKERGLHAQRRDKGESNKHRRKPRRQEASRSGSGVVQSFQAKNVRQDRLTVWTTLMTEACVDQSGSYNRERSWGCSTRAECRHQSKAVAVSHLLHGATLQSNSYLT